MNRSLPRYYHWFRHAQHAALHTLVQQKRCKNTCNYMCSRFVSTTELSFCLSGTGLHVICLLPDKWDRDKPCTTNPVSRDCPAAAGCCPIHPWWKRRCTCYRLCSRRLQRLSTCPGRSGAKVHVILCVYVLDRSASGARTCFCHMTAAAAATPRHFSV